MTIRPSGSTPPVTGDACGLPSDRLVIRIIRWRGRTKSSRSSRLTLVFVAMVRGTRRSCQTGGVGGGLETSGRAVDVVRDDQGVELPSIAGLTSLPATEHPELLAPSVV